MRDLPGLPSFCVLHNWWLGSDSLLEEGECIGLPTGCRLPIHRAAAVAVYFVPDRLGVSLFLPLPGWLWVFTGFLAICFIC